MERGTRKLLARRVRLLRVGRGWSQEALAAASGLHRNYIGHVERSELNVGLDNLEKIALALGVSLCTLLEPDEASLGDFMADAGGEGHGQ
ncbi:MAG: helix-turn-helix transcriptional regulator [Pseudomonadota bacterium]|nr:helix-turn-helix transcriptional regulator [Pseudomonadota bacterium]